MEHNYALGTVLGIADMAAKKVSSVLVLMLLTVQLRSVREQAGHYSSVMRFRMRNTQEL